jgi:hypothetical protein
MGYYKKALTIQVRALGPDHQNIEPPINTWRSSQQVELDCKRFLVVLRGLTGLPLHGKDNRHGIVRGANILAV